MRRLLCALAFVTLAACGDDAAELGDVDAATAEPRLHDDSSCFAMTSYRIDEGRSVLVSPYGMELEFAETIKLSASATKASACEFACEWEAEHCEGGARETCGSDPTGAPVECLDKWEAGDPIPEEGDDG